MFLRIYATFANMFTFLNKFFIFFHIYFWSVRFYPDFVTIFVRFYPYFVTFKTLNAGEIRLIVPEKVQYSVGLVGIYPMRYANSRKYPIIVRKKGARKLPKTTYYEYGTKLQRKFH